MAKYIQFPVTIEETGDTTQVFNTDTITLVTNEGDTNLYIYCGLILYSYQLADDHIEKGVEMVNAINEAILAVPGPTLTNVNMPPHQGLIGPSVINITSV